MQHIPGLYYAASEISGRGMFCAHEILKGSLIEICPVVVLPEEELPVIHSTKLHDYYFTWGIDQKQCAIALGYGSVYNHAKSSNAEYNLNLADKTIEIIAVKNILAGDEITINYNGESGDGKPVWFEKDKK